MATLTHTPKTLVSKVKTLLRKQLKSRGINPTIRAETIPPTTLVRFSVTAPEFAKLTHAERQSIVWNVLTDALTRDEILDISSIHTFAPEDLRE